MKSKLQNMIEELEDALVVEVINTKGALSDGEINALLSYDTKARECWTVIRSYQLLQSVKNDFEKKKGVEQADGVLRRSGKYPWKSKED